jgi:hypothetical protein
MALTTAAYPAGIPTHHDGRKVRGPGPQGRLAADADRARRRAYRPVVRDRRPCRRPVGAVRTDAPEDPLRLERQPGLPGQCVGDLGEPIRRHHTPVDPRPEAAHHHSPGTGRARWPQRRIRSAEAWRPVIPGRAHVQAVDAISSPVGPDHTDDHQPRPVATIRHHGSSNNHGRGRGRVDHARSPVSCAWCADSRRVPGRAVAHHRLRNRSKVVRSRAAMSGCANSPRLPDLLVHRLGCRIAQALSRPEAATACAQRAPPSAGRDVWQEGFAAVTGRGRRSAADGMRRPSARRRPVVRPVAGPTMTQTRDSCPHRDRGRPLVVAGRMGHAGYPKARKQHSALGF